MPLVLPEALEAAVGTAAACRAWADANALGRLLPPGEASRQYLEPVVRGDLGAVAELFAVARASLRAAALRPHPAGRGRRRCDALLTFQTSTIHLEVKHRRDTFPFNRTGTEVAEGLTAFAGSRPGADHRYLGDPPPETTDGLPGATIWRNTLEGAASQLPLDGTGLIAVSCDAHLGLDEDTCAALFGDPVLVARPNPRGWGSLTEERRLGNGFFGDERNAHIAAVWFFRLARSDDGGGPILLCDWARGALNPGYGGPPLPDELTFALPNVFGTQD